MQAALAYENIKTLQATMSLKMCLNMGITVILRGG